MSAQRIEGAVAITGAGGYIGSALADELEKSGARLLLVSRRELKPRPNARTVCSDVRTLECWLEIVRFADVIMHLAGNTSVYVAAADPTESLNSTLLPVTQLIKAASMLGRRPRVIFASTATVYGMATSLPVVESTKAKPVTIYDLHKLFVERQLEISTDQMTIEGVSLRLANVYGPSLSSSGADDRGVINKVTASAVAGNDIFVFGDGRYTRDYVYIDDVVAAFIAAGAHEKPRGAFNVGSGTGITIREAFGLVAEKAATVTGRRVSVRTKPWPATADCIEHRNFIADISRIARDLHWAPKVDMVDGLKLLVDSCSA